MYGVGGRMVGGKSEVGGWLVGRNTNTKICYS